MKSIQAIGLGVLFSLLVACGQIPNESQENSTSEPQTEETISYQSANSEVAEVHEPILKREMDSSKQDIITIHGYANFFTKVSFLSDMFVQVNWGYWEEHAFKGLNVRHIVWDSSKRIQDQLPNIISQFQSFLVAGHCRNGCLVFTHSTGGLVVDMLLSRSLESANTANDFSDIWAATTAVVEVASAGGGVQLADYAGDAVMGACNNFLVKAALETLFPFLECGNPQSLGAGYDLRPSVARSINGSDNIRTPALMIAGNGNMMGNIAKPFLKGTSDGLVAMHSACGSNKFEAYESCSPEMGADGYIQPHTAPNGFYRYHYPFIMTREGHTSELRPLFLNTDLLTPKTETIIHSYGYGNFAVEEYSTGWWLWKKSYQNIVNSKDVHLSGVIGKYFIF